jgi:F5/8 type C domain
MGDARMPPFEPDPGRPPRSAGAPLSRRAELLLCAAIFLCVAGSHIWMVWMAPTAFTFSPGHVHTDNAVMLLMGKHILEKGELPIFYYGQDWFGSLSAFVHAAVFLVLGGIPPWSIHVAPLLFFLGFCLVLYLLTRETLGPAVALVALAWNIVTPVPLSEYTVMPHGGYVEGLMLGTVILWLSVCLALAREPWKKTGHYALLGFAGGVGWWTSPLVIYQILTSAAYVILRERLRAVWKGAILSVPAFLLGAAPFFYFYALDPYSDVLSMGGGYALRHIPGGLYLLFVERLPQYLGWDLFQSPLPLTHWLGALVYGWALVFFLWHLRRSFSARSPLRNAAIFPIFFLVFALLLAASIHVRRNAPLYVIPLSALLPVAIGFWLVHSRHAWRLAAGAACAALFLLHGWTTASWVVTNAPRAEGSTQGHLGLVRDLEAKGVKQLYLQSRPGSELLNFYARERIIASQMLSERYPPYFDALERDPEPAFLYPRGTRGLAPTLKALGASYETEPLGDYDLVRHVRPMDRRYRQVPVANLRASASHATDDMRYALDRDMDSSWTSGELRKPGMWVQFDLGRLVDVGMVRLWNRGEDHGSYAMDIRVETSVDGRAWHEAVTRSPMELLYWSGPRVYPWEWGYRWEARFPPVEARFVRITQYEKEARFPWIIAEAYVYEDLGARTGSDAGEQDVLQRIRDLGLGRVYADRWMSAKISESSGGRIETVTPFTLAVPQYYVRLTSRVIRWDEKTGFVLADADADEFERSMKEEDVHHLSREDIGRWALFHSKRPAASLDARDGDPGWWWNGLGAVSTDRKKKSRYLAALAQNTYRQGSVERALRLSGQAVHAYPFNRAARQVLIQALNDLGRAEEAAEQSRLLKDLTEPQVKTTVEFRGTLELLGYTPSPEPARPGRDVGVRYFWKVKRDPGPRQAIGVLVHLQSASGRFRSDFPLLSRHEGPIWPPALEDEILVQDERITVPAHATPGTYQILVGVYDLGTGKRWKVSAGASGGHRDRVPVGVLRVERSETP